MRRTFVEAFGELARRDPDVLLITGDLGYNQFEALREDFPRQFINAGVAEQNMVGLAAGLAKAGKKPYVYSILPFVSFRPYEHIRNDLCYHKLDVTLVACGTGFSYGPAGTTHHGLEDLAAMRALPNMVVVSPTHKAEVAEATRASYAHVGPLYLRITRGPAPDFPRDDTRFELGRGAYIRRQAAPDVTVLTTGDIAGNVLQALDMVQADGLTCSAVSLHTAKPLDFALLEEVFQQSRLVVSVEEHNVCGGLGAAIAEYAAQIDRQAAFRMIGVPDEFCKTNGSEAEMRQAYALDPAGLYGTIRAYWRKLAT
jgi:transketolase